MKAVIALLALGVLASAVARDVGHAKIRIARSPAGYSKSRDYFDRPIKLGIPGRSVLLRYVNVRFDADSFQQLFRRGVPGSARNPHEEVVADRFRVAADHLAGGSCADYRRQPLFCRKRRDAFPSACGRFVHQNHDLALKAIFTKPLCFDSNGWVREAILRR